MLLIIW